MAMDEYPPHPYAIQHHPKFWECGAMDIRHGQEFIDTLDGRRGRLDEALSDGDAFVTWEDGTYGTAKWHRFVPAPQPTGEADR